MAMLHTDHRLLQENRRKRGDVELRVFTFSVDQANKLLEERGIKNYSVTSVPPDQMTEALRDVKFGFVLRDDIAVNNVATPTKLSSYLSAGVIPVYSTALKDFHEKRKGCIVLYLWMTMQ